MNTDEPAVDRNPEIADENGSSEPIANDPPPSPSPNSHFAELLKAIEHWVQTR